MRSRGRNWSTRDELFPGILCFRIRAYTFGAVRDVIQSRLWQLAVGRDLTFYTKPSFAGLVLREKSSVVPGFSEGSSSFEPPRALAPGQRSALKGPDFGELTVLLKRYPDTKLECSAPRYETGMFFAARQARLNGMHSPIVGDCAITKMCSQ